jgi:hypothetical protein
MPGCLTATFCPREVAPVCDVNFVDYGLKGKPKLYFNHGDAGASPFCLPVEGQGPIARPS